MTEKSIDVFIVQICSKSSQKDCHKKTDDFLLDDIWSLDFLDLNEYGLKNNNRGYRYVLVVFDNFSKFVWTVPLKNKNAKSINDAFENNL